MILWDMLRDRNSSVTGALSSSGDFYIQSNVIARGFYSVRWPYDIPTPNNLTFFLDSCATGDWVLISLQYRNGTTFSVTINTGIITTMTQAQNLTKVLQEPKSYYYYDASTEHLYLKVQNFASRTSLREVYNFVDFYSTGVISVLANFQIMYVLHVHLAIQRMHKPLTRHQ
jgi:cell migration-inducing and hyaluronan-binding protein